MRTPRHAKRLHSGQIPLPKRSLVAAKNAALSHFLRSEKINTNMFRKITGGRTRSGRYADGGRFPAKLLPDGAGPFSPVRRLFLEHLKQAHDLDQLRFFGNIADLASPVALNRTLGTKHILRRQRFGYARRQEQLGAGKFKPIKSRSPQARYNVTFSMKDMLSRRFASKFGSPCTDAAKGSYEKLPA